MNITAGLAGTQSLRTCLFVGLCCIFFFVNACNQGPEEKLSASLMAEFDPQESTFICWVTQFQEISLTLIQEISRDDPVTLFYNQRNHRPENLQKLLEERKINVKNVTLAPFELEKDNIWIRDYGPILMQEVLLDFIELLRGGVLNEAHIQDGTVAYPLVRITVTLHQTVVTA